MFEKLDPLLHSQLRLSIISLLYNLEEAEFVFLQEQTNATAGNISLQLNKLKNAGYIEIKKAFKSNYPVTICKITEQGIHAFEKYAKDIQNYLKPKK